MTIPYTSIVLAAGSSTRMMSQKSKVLHEVGHLPLLYHVLNLTPKAIVVVSPYATDVQNAVRKSFPNVQFAIQEQPLGTGNAVMAGLSSNFHMDQNVLILYGDTPFLQQETINRLLTFDSDCVLLAMHPTNPDGYGRIVTNSQNRVIKIVESIDATQQEKEITLCWGGCLLIKSDILKTFLPLISNENKKGEYYLTTLIELLSKTGHRVTYITTDEEELLGINSRQELAEAEHIFQKKMRRKAYESGATLEDPNSVFFAYDTVLNQDVHIEPNVYFGPGVTIEKGTRVRAFSHIQGVHIGEDCIVGPFARIRPHTTLENNTHVGNFVEIKNSLLKKASKANHLSYIGDTSVGESTNIGAGTITCNYDGFSKHRTDIGSHVLVGSNTALIAPVIIGDHSIIGAGSIITEMVPSNSLVIERSTQNVIQDGASKYRNKRKEFKSCVE